MPDPIFIPIRSPLQPISISSGPSIWMASGYFALSPARAVSSGIPEFLSSAKWTDDSRGVPQQTFLGASIRSFNMQGGFGDSSSTLNVDLVVDEFNKSDGTAAGFGDDPYHSGVYDKFVPPIPGSPVFFKFGPNRATIDQAYRKTFDELYYYNTTTSSSPTVADFGHSIILTQVKNGSLSINPPLSFVRLPGSIVTYPSFTPTNAGNNHIVFGGILQTYTQNRSSAGNPLYSVGVVDPREILSNVIVILNNYAGPAYGQNNILNVYGFLEFNTNFSTQHKNELKKFVNTTTGEISFSGDDKWWTAKPPDLFPKREAIRNAEIALDAAKRLPTSTYANIASLYQNIITAKIALRNAINNASLAGAAFPITGTGFSRRGPQGIPFYRVKDAINALMGFNGPLPDQYKHQGFGGKINFRGFNYVVDFGGLPELPEFYYLDFDQINLLELALEICDITNRDLFVSLLPVIDHPACKALYNYNNGGDTGTPPNDADIIAGIIRLDTVDRSEQPFYGSVKHYIDSVRTSGIYVENQDLGYELTNVTTDKFVVGAQEIDTYFFSTNADRDMLAIRSTSNETGGGYQWKLETSLQQQVLPYYGKLGDNAVTIPKGFGAYQQILLDASNLNAGGVGAYYVATEMELRCALVSFDRWKEFLLTYNDIYMESVEADDTAEAFAAGETPNPGTNNPPMKLSQNYAVTVPRSVFDTYVSGSFFNSRGLPNSACNPPYGYPLYYKRATQIGIPEGGLTNLFSRWVQLNTNLAELTNASPKDILGVLQSQYQRLKSSPPLTAFEQQYFKELERVLKNPTPKDIQSSLGFLEDIVRGNGKRAFAILPKLAKKNNQNAIKVYEFVKSVAEENLGKKFLVKIPQRYNKSYDKKIVQAGGNYTQGPFGFRPRSTKNILGYEFGSTFKSEFGFTATSGMIPAFLSSGTQNVPNVMGALRVNFNPISEKYESNYTPMNLGGYFPFDLYQNTLGASGIASIRNAGFNNLPSGVSQGLIPQDLTNFIDKDGRVSAYVRFDHSENLTLEGLNSSDFTQQYIVGNYMIPDLTEALDNNGPSEFNSFPNIDSNYYSDNSGVRHPQVLFVKCSVDEQLYFPPKIISRSIQVYGQKVKDIGTKSLPNKIYVPCSGISNGIFIPGTGVIIDSWTYYLANYVPLPDPGPSVTVLDFDRIAKSDLPGGTNLNNSVYVNSSFDSLDTKHAYALITLPNRIVPNKDSRFRDGQYQHVNTEKFKHLMTMDVVRGLPGFDTPKNPNKPPTGNLKDVARTNINLAIKAWFVMKKAHQGLCFGFPFTLNVAMPSPVYPDLVALPLMSNDRCYGPWISSQLDGQAYILKNIGGKLEFIKDENLSPWNYGGYTLMDQAGRMQAEFSNSLLLFSERGSFTIPDVPRSSSLCRSLLIGGPLVTNINVDISSNGARTTYQMDLYTPSFGKLQKQKQEEISKISRERKRIMSERNALIRRGLSKNQSSRDFDKEYDMMNRGIMPGLNQLGLGMANAMTSLVASMNPSQKPKWSSIAGRHNVTEYDIAGSLQNPNQAGQAAQLFTDQLDMAGSYGNSCERPLIGPETDNPMFSPMSHGYHAAMPYRPNSTIDAMNDLYFIDKDDLEDNWGGDVTKYGDTA